MAKIIVSKEARKDLLTIRQYIREELNDPDASRRIIAELKKSILSLTDFPNRGQPLDALIDVHTEYRYLLCKNYAIFYLVSEKELMIVRILHQRQDHLKVLLS